MNRKKNNQTTDVDQPLEQADSTRRRVLLGSLGGAAALSVWHTPVINSVMLPAHAQTSMLLPKSFFKMGGTTAYQPTKQGLLDVFIPAAHAGTVATAEGVSVLATKKSETSYGIELLNNSPNLVFVGTLNTDGSPGTLSVGTPLDCPFDFDGEPDDVYTASITDINQTELNLNLDTGKAVYDIMVPEATGTLPIVCRVIPE